MAALRLVRKWGVPLATAAGAPLLLPVVRAESGGEGVKEAPPAHPTSRMVRPSDLPIYEEPEEVLDFEYYGRDRTSLEEGVGVVRKEVEGILEATRTARERIAHIYETGKAHSMATVDYLTDEENMLPRAGAITVGGLAGLVIGARRRGGFIKKVLYTSTGVLTAASLCYPRQAYAISQQVYGAAKNYGAIGYNFVVGVKPQSKASTPPEEAKAPEKEVETSATPPAPEDTPPTTTDPTAESQSAEVRSAVVLSLPPGKSLVDTLAEQASDITVLGFRLTDKEGSAAPSTTPTKATTPQDAPPTVPEGFGSVSTAVTSDDSSKVVLGEEEGGHEAVAGEKEATGTTVGDEGGRLAEEVVEAIKEGAAVVEEKVAVVEGKVLLVVEGGVIAAGEKVAQMEEKASEVVVEVLTPALGEEEAKEVVEKVETVVGDAVEKVAEMVEGKVAVVVEEAAKEVEEGAAVLEQGLEVVEETGEKVEQVLDVVERVTGAVEEAAEKFPAVPVEEVEKVEKVVEGTEAAVESIVEAVKEVEGLTEEVRKEAEKVEEEAAEVMESEEKRKEVLEEVVETLEEKEKQDSAVVEEQAAVPPPQLEEATQDDQKEVDTTPVAQVTPAVPKEREGLLDKLVNFFSKPDKDAVESPKEEQSTSKVTETGESASDAKTPDTIHVEGTHTPQLAEGEGGAGGVPVGEGGSLVEQEVEAVKEGAAAIGETAAEVEKEAVEPVESGKEVVETLMEQEEQDIGVVSEQAADVPLLQPKETPQETIMDTPLVEPLTPALPQEREGLFDKLVSLFKPDKGADEGVKEEQIAEAPGKSIPSLSVTQEVMLEVKSEPELKESTTEASGRSDSQTALKTNEELEKGIVSEVKEEVRQEVTEEKGQPENVEGEKEVETGWVMVEMEKQGQVEEAAGENPQDVSSEVKGSREGEVKEEAPVSGAVPTGEREGLFDQLVRLFTKDEEKPGSSSDVVVPQEAVLAGPGAGGVPLPGEGEGKELSSELGTLGREDEVLSAALVQEDVACAKPEDTASVPAPEDTAQAPDVPQVTGETTQITDTSTGHDDTAQIPSLPAVPDDTAQSLDAAQVPKDTEQAGSETVREPSSTQGSEEREAGGTAGHPPPPPPPPPPVEKKNIFEKLASLFQKEEQEQEPQLHEAATENVEEPLTAAQETGPHARQSEAAAEAESPQKESSIVSPTEDSSPESLREPVTEDTGPTGSDVPTVVITMEGKEEEEAPLAAAEEATSQQPQVSSPQTEAEVVEEGKDIIVKLEPATPEKDFGQSNPEDSDMYTTRG